MPSTPEIYRELLRRTEARQVVATITVVRTRGSVPRRIGAKMLVWRGGSIGTVGGGFSEADSLKAALEAMDTGQTRIVTNDYGGALDLTARGTCGGTVSTLVEVWRDPEEPRQIVAELERTPQLAIARIIDTTGLPTLVADRVVVRGPGATVGTTGVPALDAAIERAAAPAIAAGQATTETLRLTAAGSEEPYASAEACFEVVAPLPALVICGGGHVGQAIANLGYSLGFRVVVVDDRPEFASPELFPGADEVIAELYGAALARLDLTSNTYLVLVTRGHRFDLECLRAILGRPAAYIGMIGSKRRVWSVYKLLQGEGIPVSEMARVYAPIGLDIAAETPEEIAVSILAEVIKVRRGGQVLSMADSVRERYARLLREGGIPEEA